MVKLGLLKRIIQHRQTDRKRREREKIYNTSQLQPHRLGTCRSHHIYHQYSQFTLVATGNFHLRLLQLPRAILPVSLHTPTYYLDNQTPIVFLTCRKAMPHTDRQTLTDRLAGLRSTLLDVCIL